MTRHRTIVVLIVKAVLIAAVLFVLTEIHSEENLTADMEITLNGVEAFSGYSRGLF